MDAAPKAMMLFRSRWSIDRIGRPSASAGAAVTTQARGPTWIGHGLWGRSNTRIRSGSAWRGMEELVRTGDKGRGLRL